MSQFTHLHLHTEYSLLDGANKLKELADTLKEQGVTSVAMTDHGNMFGAIDFYQTMKSRGIKPIIGLEAYLHNHDDISDKSSRQRFHLCLYAKNEIGYQNLMYLSSQSYIHGLYYYPRINKKILEKHSEGLICSSACLQGEINWHLNIQSQRNARFGAKGYDSAKEAALWYKDVFKDDFYLEIMRHGIYDQRCIDDDIIRLSKELNIKIIATNDTHYTFKERAAAHEVFMCIAMGKKLNDPDRMRHSVHEFYVKTPQQMAELFLDIPEAIENTQEVAQKCNLELNLGNPTPPNFKFTREYAKEHNLQLKDEKKEFSFDNDDIVFEYLCNKGLEERLKFIDQDRHKDYKERLQREIEIIKNMKFSGYMLIVHDFIAVAKSKGIPVGPGRGSAAGSLVAYCLKITDLDPLPYSLLFERFLNPERVSMPDIDVDFCQDRRGEVIDYVIDKYGSDKVAQVITFGKLLARGVIRDVARVCDMSIPDADELAKLIPEELKITLDSAYEKEPKIKEFIDRHPKGHEVWEYAKALEGLNRNAGMHAAGVVISNESLWKKTPLFRQSKNDERHLVTQYSKDHLEDVDLIKFDFLGLKTLTVINNAINLIKKRYNKEIIWESIDVNDPKVYKTIQSGNTLGIFQIESDGMQSLNARLKPERFEDLIAVLALYRPGPMESGMLDDFIDRKHGLKDIKYPFDVLKEVLEPTYGVIVYQEQVMQIVQIIGGFSLGGADVVRRAMGKKDPEKMKKLKDEFADGAEKQGYNRKEAEDLWELILKFAGYGFNKSHSAAYALITFQTAYLKTYYPSEFMAALLTSEENNVTKIAVYIDEMKKMNIKLLPPSINKAIREFSAIEQEDGKDAIVYGLGAIKSVGIPAVENLIEARESGEFKDINDFLGKIEPSKINKRALESLIKAGAFDEFGYTRKCLFDNLENLSEGSRKMAEVRKNAASSLFGEEELSSGLQANFIVKNDEFEIMEKLDFEKEILGIYVSGHPLDRFYEEFKDLDYVKSIDFSSLKGSGEILSIGKIEGFKTMMSKNNKRYGRLEILDFYSAFDVTVFESNIEELDNILKDEELKNRAYGFLLSYKSDEGKVDSFALRSIKKIEELKEGDFKAIKKFSTKKIIKENKDFTEEPKEFEKNIIELDISKLNRELIYEIHDIARNAHNPNEKGNRKLVLKIISAGSCLLYHTDFIISENISQKIIEKYAG
ncbi:DNA polymerase III subunit alpha [Campylobacter sp. LH-2024]|uniref:DNA polymerase III subunit alpha n=1 Tax=Campylobacter molothri TaxID=1032242 RepID=A0ACC5W305_9BACT|nr:DNA polymerase III subunit alpha [Campylobacter sp. RM10542]MBZ7931505.1 DNA polymerase III subunit alpha [Campylobacter sp. RM12910]MBZ7934922.1 DNA polymerase III subunit alpha [Campylobacter sp. W0065]MBZ7941202.1 DNA polymerase III subunit alpha [Campylobacter sp. W0047]MBZ7948592.1 DNA polymerase III subunit alpha [Campylobacter sp. RM9929]MBZ7958880.1 DNA polymerase III subunit alpha [Campylobacter sp. RM9760]MBZ7961822.1 DNA polymerase III subunit alpha [Campylobacter sp. RM9930]MB